MFGMMMDTGLKFYAVPSTHPIHESLGPHYFQTL